MRKNALVFLICLVLTLVTLAVFWQVKDHEFVNYDDPPYVTENPQVQAGLTLQSITWAFTTSHAGNWHPLTWLSHMLDYQLFGLQPSGHHLVNLFFHIANTLLLFLVLYRMTKVLWPSAFVAALFALHPLHVESVAWVAERKDVLGAFFWMLTMGAYVHYGERPGIGRYSLALVFFVLGLMAKPMLVTLPFVLLLLDYWPLGRLQPAAPGAADSSASGKKNPGRKKRKAAKGYPAETMQNKTPGFVLPWPTMYSLVREKIPFFAFSVISSVITFYAQQKGGAMLLLKVLPLDARMVNALVSSVSYVGKMIWPRDLSVLYPYPVMQPVWQILGAALVLVAITILVIGGAKRYPYLVVGWFWFLGTLVPVIGLVQVGIQAMADRYTYVPFIGLFIMIAWGVPQLLKKWPYRQAALATSASAILIFCMVVTHMQLQYWQDSITLFSHALSITTNSGTAYMNMGIATAYYNRGFAYGRLGNYQQAIEDYNKAIELTPQDATAYYNRGLAYGRLGNDQQAIKDYDKAIELDPQYAAAYYNRGVAYGHLGNDQHEMRDYNKAVELNPQDAKAYNNRGVAYGRLGNYQEAIKDFSKVIELNPEDATAYYNRGFAYGHLANYQQAIEDFKTAAKWGDKSAQDYLRSKGITW